MSVTVDNVSELKKLLNKKVAVTDYFEVTQERINTFAEATEDRQWIHIDTERARDESPYRATVAHGFLTLSLFSAFLTSAVKLKGVKMGVNCGLNYVRFLAPIPVGTQIRAHITLKALEETADGAQVTWEIMIEIKNATRPASVGEWIVRYFL